MAAQGQQTQADGSAYPSDRGAGSSSLGQPGEVAEGHSGSQRKLDSKNFTCMYCSGSIDFSTKKFVHDKRCQLASSNSNPKLGGNTASGSQSNQPSQRKSMNKAASATNQNHSEVSTQGSNSVSRAAASVEAEFS